MRISRDLSSDEMLTIIQMYFCAAREAPNPCLSGACGPNSECHVIGGRPVCSCSFGMLGTPPNCRPECVIHQECPSNRACIAQQCQDPCIGSCGFNARCNVQNHQPICSCIEGFEGDPYASCTPRQSEYIIHEFLSPTAGRILLSPFFNLIYIYIKNNFKDNFHILVATSSSPIFIVFSHHFLFIHRTNKVETESMFEIHKPRI